VACIVVVVVVRVLPRSSTLLRAELSAGLDGRRGSRARRSLASGRVGSGPPAGSGASFEREGRSRRILDVSLWGTVREIGGLRGGHQSWSKLWPGPSQVPETGARPAHYEWVFRCAAALDSAPLTVDLGL